MEVIIGAVSTRIPLRSQGDNLCKYSGPHACVCVCAKSLQSCLTLCDPIDCSPPSLLSMGFSRQEYWSSLPFPPPGNFPDPGIEPTSLVSPALAGRFFTTSVTWEAPGPHECSLNGVIVTTYIAEHS